jgi:hypothetical protein
MCLETFNSWVGYKLDGVPVHFIRDMRAYFLRWWIVSPTPDSQAVGDYLFQYIRSYPPYLEVVSSIRNLRTRHAVVIRDPPNIDLRAQLCLSKTELDEAT